MFSINERDFYGFFSTKCTILPSCFYTVLCLKLLVPTVSYHQGETLIQCMLAVSLFYLLHVIYYYRRSSLLPHCKQLDPQFDEHLLSPVLSDASSNMLTKTNNILQFNCQLSENDSKIVLTGLRDPIENKLTLSYSDGTYYRIGLPSLASSSLVESCLATFRQCLCRDATAITLTRWYAKRNGPGAQDLNGDQEWAMFTALIFGELSCDFDFNDNAADTRRYYI